MGEDVPSTEEGGAGAVARAKVIEPGTVAGTVPQSDPSPVPPPNAEGAA